MNMRCASTPRRPGRAGPAARRSGRGFTLIELMVAVVVAGILASLALPAFFDVVRKSRRSEAFAALASLQQAQERFRANNAAYTDDMTALARPTVTANGYYAISVPSATATSYTLRAQAKGSQAKDSNCATMVLRLASGSVQYGSACTGCTLADPLTDPGRCWSQQ